ncbi:MAG: GntR family transcriptional regulator [Synergistaceae bacterium]
MDIPRYQKIALEIASRIVSGEYEVGQKIYARSSIASQFAVSPETARRAICVLCDLDIVVSEAGSGVTIKSLENALAFVKQNEKRITLDTMKDDLLNSIKRQKVEMEQISEEIKTFIDASAHFRSMNPFMPFEVKITKECKCLGKTAADIRLWQYTGATLLAVKHKDALLKSPGAYISFSDGDILYFITQDDSPQKVTDFLYNEKQ